MGPISHLAHLLGSTSHLPPIPPIFEAKLPPTVRAIFYHTNILCILIVYLINTHVTDTSVFTVLHIFCKKISWECNVYCLWSDVVRCGKVVSLTPSQTFYRNHCHKLVHDVLYVVLLCPRETPKLESLVFAKVQVLNPELWHIYKADVLIPRQYDASPRFF